MYDPGWQRWLGHPLAAWLTCLRRAGDAARWVFPTGAADRLLPWYRTAPSTRPGDAPRHRPPRVVLIKLTSQSSSVTMLPAIRRLTERYPGIELHLLCRSADRAIVDALPGVRFASVDSLRDDDPLGALCDAYAALRRLQPRNFDAAISFDVHAPLSAVLGFLTGAPYRVGFHQFDFIHATFHDLFTHRVLYNPRQHAAVSFASLVDVLGAPVGQTPLLKSDVHVPASLPTFQPPEHVRQTIQELLHERGWSFHRREPTIIVHIEPDDPILLRHWPLARFQQLVQQLAAETPQPWIVLTSFSRHLRPLRTLAAVMDNPRFLDLAGRLSIRQWLMLCLLSRTLVCTDGDAAHLAALTPIRIVTLYGPRDPAVHAPLSPRHTALHTNIACRPCLPALDAKRSPCRDNQCLQQLTVASVLEATRRPEPTTTTTAPAPIPFLWPRIRAT